MQDVAPAPPSTSQEPAHAPWVFLLALATALLASGTLVALAWDGWVGEPRTTTGFCEDSSHTRLIKQPANTWSNLGFMVVGLLCAWLADRDRRTASDHDNPLRSTRLFPGLFCSIIVLLGPASMALHGSNTAWGGRVDLYSMFLFVGFPLVYSLTRTLRLGVPVFVGLLLLLDLVMAGAVFSGWANLIVFGAFVVVVAISEAVRAYVRKDLTRDYRWVALALGSFLVAFGIWIPSRTGGPLCDPYSLLQGHALWHLLCAVSVGSLFLYLRSERPA